jgi:hypothetical protein
MVNGGSENSKEGSLKSQKGMNKTPTTQVWI